MSSAFRRAAKKPTVPSPGASLSTGHTATAPKATSGATTASLFNLRGVKPWTGGIHLTSVGLNDLDVILGGGQPLGTCILLQEDRFARDLAVSLMRYWCAEVRISLNVSSTSYSRLLLVSLLYIPISPLHSSTLTVLLPPLCRSRQFLMNRIWSFQFLEKTNLIP